jgi:hypothetical protein
MSVSIKKSLLELIRSACENEDGLELGDEIVSREAAESLLDGVELEIKADDFDTIILNSDVTVLSTVSDWLGHLYYVSAVVVEMFRDLTLLRSELNDVSSRVSLPIVLADDKRDFTEFAANLYKSLDVFANPMIVADGRTDIDVKNAVQSSIVRVANFLSLLDFYLHHRNKIDSLGNSADVHNVFVSLAYYLSSILNDTIRLLCSNFFFDLSKMPVMLEATSKVISIRGDKVPMIPFALTVRHSSLNIFRVAGSVMSLAYVRREGLAKKSLADEAVANILRSISQDVLSAVRAAAGDSANAANTNTSVASESKQDTGNDTATGENQDKNI